MRAGCPGADHRVMQLSTAPATLCDARYALARIPEEYERLRLQSRAWETATGRLLARIGLAPGACCLDAGRGPGETMRLMAELVGPAGRVTARWHRRVRTPRAARRSPDDVQRRLYERPADRHRA